MKRKDSINSYREFLYENIIFQSFGKKFYLIIEYLFLVSVSKEMIYYFDINVIKHVNHFGLSLSIVMLYQNLYLNNSHIKSL